MGREKKVCMNGDDYMNNMAATNIYEPRQANLCLRAFRHDKF